MEIIMIWLGIGIVAVVVDKVDLRRNVERLEIDENVEVEE